MPTEMIIYYMQGTDFVEEFLHLIRELNFNVELKELNAFNSSNTITEDATFVLFNSAADILKEQSLDWLSSMVIITKECNEIERRDLFYKGVQDVILFPTSVAELKQKLKRYQQNGKEKKSISYEQLLENQQLLQSIFDNSFQLMGLLDVNGILIYANKTSLSMIDVPQERVLGKHFAETPWWNHSRIEQLKLRKAISQAQEGEFVRFNTIHIDDEGGNHFIDFSLNPIKNKQGEVLFIIPEGRDISEYRELSEQQKKSEERYRLLIENTPSIVWIKNRLGRFTYISTNVLKTIGYSAEEILEQPDECFYNQIHEDDVELVHRAYKEFYQNHENYDIEFRLKHKKGHWLYFNDRAEYIRNISGQKHAFGIMSDISKLKASEHSLKRALQKATEKENTYTTLFENAGDAILVMKEDVIEDGNTQALSMFKSTFDELIGASLLRFCSDDKDYTESNAELLLDTIKKALLGAPQFMYWKFKRLNGEPLETEISLNPIVVEDQKKLLVIIKELELDEQQADNIRKMEAQYKEFYEQAVDGIITGNEKGEIVDINIRACQLTNYSKKDLVGKKIYVLFDEQQMKEKPLRFDLLNEGKSLTFERDFISKEGERLPMIMSSKRLSNGYYQAIIRPVEVK